MTWPTDPAGRSRGEAGFTLIEVLVVLVILGLAAGLVLGRGPSRSAGLDLRAQASQLAQALRGARGQAIATNRMVGFAFDPASRSFRVGGGPPRMLATAAQVSVVADDGAAIRFSPDGSAAGGRIALAEGSVRIAVVVDWLTGRVRIIDAN